MHKRTDPIYQAQDILSRRDHAEFEVRQKLKRKGFTPAQVEEAVAWLYTHRLLDDRAFARRFVESTLLMKPVGPRYLQFKLKQKGVASSIIDEAISAALAERSEAEILQEAIEKWRRSHPRYQHDRERLTRYLVARGFSMHHVRDSVATLGE